ncbi:MAG TPA: alpha-L-arabinofuranosidase C-terminal domain-containing protein, partial [Lachnospiraceae bacterium]|nr:alpha-L-arabinofuranosidase C-terminal domain-containing protein [Lachnospiraceae bacterium]
EVNPHYLSVTTTDKLTGFLNKAYDGIALEKGKRYRVSFYAKSDSYNGMIRITVMKDDTCYAAFTVQESIVNEWNEYECIIEATETVRNADFIVTMTEPGSVDFDFISMMPYDAVLGIFRQDLVKWLKDFNPGFLRFPGGCIVEGNEITNRYQWKKTIGLPRDRKVNWNRWAVHDNWKVESQVGPYSHYNQTLGIGYYEYFILCEYLGAKPIPVQNVGLACQYQSSQKVSLDSEEFQEYIDDVLDLIEFANGDKSTKWGSIRAEMGHEEPFGLEYIGIGNEQWETNEVDYFNRYEKFEKVIHKMYPDIKLLSSAGPNVKSETYDAAWEWVLKRQKENPNFTAGIDEHYYVSPQWFYENTDFYDSYDRSVKVFAGEYAAHVGNGMNRPDVCTMEAALAEAAYMTGLERNADVVYLAAYAPLFARVGYTQWSPDLIWFDDKDSYATPSYYVQKMYSRHMGDYTLQSKLTDDTEGLYQTVSYNESGKEIIIKLVNANASCKEIKILIDDEYKVKENGTMCVLKTDNLSNYNSIEDPTKVVPIGEELKNIANAFSVTLSPMSFQVVRITLE